MYVHAAMAWSVENCNYVNTYVHLLVLVKQPFANQAASHAISMYYIRIHMVSSIVLIYVHEVIRLLVLFLLENDKSVKVKV